jgi:hypothetical protein
MRKIGFFFVFCIGWLFSFGQDSLFLASGATLTGDILRMNGQWIVIRSEGVKQRIPRPHTTYRLGSDYLTRSPWSIGLRWTLPLMGTNSELHALFQTHNLNDYSQNWLFGGSRKHPISRSFSSLQLETAYLITPRIATGLIIGNTNSGEVIGYNAEPFDLHLSLEHRALNILPHAKWFSEDHRLQLLAGPVMAFHELEFTDRSPLRSSKEKSQFRVGLAVGAGLSFVENLQSYFRLELQYQLMSPLEVGPWVGRTVHFEPAGTRYEQSSIMPRSEVRASCVTVSLIYGRKVASK